MDTMDAMDAAIVWTTLARGHGGAETSVSEPGKACLCARRTPYMAL